MRPPHLPSKLRPVAADVSVAPAPFQPATWLQTLVVAAFAAIFLGLALVAFVPRPFAHDGVGPYEYHLWRWEADTILGNAFARLGIGPDPDQNAGEDALRKYFALTSQINAASASANPDAQLLAALGDERATYQNDVERLLEGYIDEAVTSAGLQRQLPLFSGVRMTWPPVDFKLTSPPQLLVRSPRARIERAGDTLLKPGLSLKDIERIEKDTDSATTVSVVISIGGLAAYPAIVRNDYTYNALLDTSSHEWVHHYLAFYPLGEQWGRGRDSITLNETTAELAGREIGNLIRKAHSITFPDGLDGHGPAGTPPTVDFNREMHQLRLDVDALLADGKVKEAEDLMGEKRQFLAANGINIRKINQAYFAFNGSYASGPTSSNPIGGKINHVWELTRDVGQFLKVMREVRNTAELDAAIQRLEKATGG